MRRDQLKIILSGILVLLLGSLIVYSYLFREDISRFLKKKESEEVSNNSKTDRVILSPEMNSEPPISPNDLNTLPTEEKKAPTSGEFSGERESMQRETAPSKEKENKSLKEEWPEEKKSRSSEKAEREKFPEDKWTPPKDETSSTYKDEESKKEKVREFRDRDDWETKADRTSKKRSSKKSKLKKHSASKTGKRIRSLETRVDRLEKKLGISPSKKKHKTQKSDKRSLEKRVRKLEREMEKLKTKE
ncbi:hypothetical protein HGB47_18020 [Leptospira yasudae]|uniref:hypothetical protein n=1 Tax=Leptospira yasudae TaxID=2202201 RepID=UPI001C4ECF97|nr:hypothetical protein [Leptospira yasudae]MBW0435507.1 hypothetical protein [Leptospira yasudae]